MLTYSSISQLFVEYLGTFAEFYEDWMIQAKCIETVMSGNEKRDWAGNVT